MACAVPLADTMADTLAVTLCMALTVALTRDSRRDGLTWDERRPRRRCLSACGTSPERDLTLLFDGHAVATPNSHTIDIPWTILL